MMHVAFYLFFLLFIVLFVVVGWQFYNGRWLSLSAGFYRMNPEERKQIDQKALGRSLSRLSFLTAVILLLVMLFPDNLEIVIGASLLLALGNWLTPSETSDKVKQYRDE